MTDIDRLVAGISCREVLADLSDFIDDALSPERVARLQAHISECDTCARFGGTVTQALRLLREGGPVGVALPDEARARLRARLTRDTLLR